MAIKQLLDEQNLSIVLICDIAGISRSAYYKWMNRKETKNETENKMLINEIIKLYEKVDGIYGYRRIKINLSKKIGKKFNHKRIYRLMKIVGLKSVIRRKKKHYVKSTPQHIAENILNRDFKAQSPNQKWLTDVTEFKYGSNQKAYLSAILDLYDMSIISYVLGHSNNNQLVFKTLDKALEFSPGARPLFHSDRGFQYTSKQFKKKLDVAKITQSMSRVGKCIDNGPMEGFFGIIKCEKYYLNSYKTFEELKDAIKEYMDFYNYERIQEKLNDQSPMEYRSLVA